MFNSNLTNRFQYKQFIKYFLLITIIKTKVRTIFNAQVITPYFVLKKQINIINSYKYVKFVL